VDAACAEVPLRAAISALGPCKISVNFGVTRFGVDPLDLTRLCTAAPSVSMRTVQKLSSAAQKALFNTDILLRLFSLAFTNAHMLCVSLGGVCHTWNSAVHNHRAASFLWERVARAQWPSLSPTLHVADWRRFYQRRASHLTPNDRIAAVSDPRTHAPLPIENCADAIAYVYSGAFAETLLRC
jgi:hypothetical protein